VDHSSGGSVFHRAFDDEARGSEVNSPDPTLEWPAPVAVNQAAGPFLLDVEVEALGPGPLTAMGSRRRGLPVGGIDPLALPSGRWPCRVPPGPRRDGRLHEHGHVPGRPARDAGKACHRVTHRCSGPVCRRVPAPGSDAGRSRHT